MMSTPYSKINSFSHNFILWSAWKNITELFETHLTGLLHLFSWMYAYRELLLLLQPCLPIPIKSKTRQCLFKILNKWGKQQSALERDVNRNKFIQKCGNKIIFPILRLQTDVKCWDSSSKAQRVLTLKSHWETV